MVGVWLRKNLQEGTPDLLITPLQLSAFTDFIEMAVTRETMTDKGW